MIGRPMPPTNEKQADFPEGAEILPNPVGTAPGFSMRLGRCRFSSSRVPHEMRHIFEETVRPAIESAAVRTSHQVRLRTFGLTESEVGERLRGLEKENPGVTLAYRAHFPEIEVKILARADSGRRPRRSPDRWPERSVGGSGTPSMARGSRASLVPWQESCARAG